MSKTYYELLDVAPSAPVDEIKRAFRREIAKYHPDKVHHLGKEFQEIAATKAAELTEAYKILTDETLRAEYDEAIADGAPPAAPHAASPPPAAEAVRPAAARPSHEPRVTSEPVMPSGSVFQQDRQRAGDLVMAGVVARFKSALDAEFGRYEAPSLNGFQVTCVPKQAFFSTKVPPRVFGRVVASVDAAAVSEAWALAVRTPKDQKRDLCVFLMGPAVATPGELAAAINQERHKPVPAGGKVFMVPVNTRTWLAHVPADAPAVVKSLLSRLKSG